MAIWYYDRTADTWEERYAGLVLETRERNFYDDSDFYAVVYEPTKNRLEHVTYDTTRFAPSGTRVDVDATDDARRAATVLVAIARYAAALRAMLDDAEKIEPGKRVSFISTFRPRSQNGGQPIPKGTQGDVFWAGVDEYKSTRTSRAYRYGVMLDVGTKLWVSEDKLAVAYPEHYWGDGQAAEYVALRPQRRWELMDERAIAAIKAAFPTVARNVARGELVSVEPGPAAGITAVI